MHQHMFCEAMVNYSSNLILVDTDFAATEDELAECLELAEAGGHGRHDQLLRPHRQDAATTGCSSRSSRKPGRRSWS